MRSQLSSALFPDAAPPPPLTARWLAVASALAVLGVVLLLLRLGWSAPLDSVWAEDGKVFLQGALHDSLPEAVGTTYAGYLHLVPRLLAELVALAPIESSARLLAVSGACLIVLCAFVVWRASAGHLPDPRLRATLAALVVLVPIAGPESLDTIAYVQWYMLFAAFWLLLWRPSSLPCAIAAAVFVALTAMSAPLSLILMPIAVLRAVATRDRRDAAIVLGYGVGAVVQLAAIVAANSDQPAAGWDADLLPAYLVRVVGGFLFGLYGDRGLWEVFGWVFVVALAAVFAALIALAVRRRGPARALSLVALGLSILLFLAAGYQRDLGDALMWPPGDSDSNQARYLIVPVLLLVSFALVQLQQRPSGLPAGRWRSLQTWLIAAAFAVALSSFYVGHGARGEPRWSDSLDQGRGECSGSSRGSAVVPLTPPGWTMRVPCRDLVG